MALVMFCALADIEVQANSGFGVLGCFSRTPCHMWEVIHTCFYVGWDCLPLRIWTPILF